MNLPEDPTIEFSGDLAPVNPETPDFKMTLQNALENRPDIESLTLQLEMAEKDADIAMGKYLPSVRLEAGFNDSNRDYDELGSAEASPMTGISGTSTGPPAFL